MPVCVRTTLLIIHIAAVILTAGNCFAGAWTAEKGSQYHKLSANYYYADELFDADGNTRDFSDNGEFRDRNISYYLEYGATGSLTLIGSVTYKGIRKEDDSMVTRTNGLSDMELGMKYRLYEGRGSVLSTQITVKIPEFYDEDDLLPLGNGQYDTEVRLLFGQSLYPRIPGYINLEAGYRLRAEEPADEFRCLVEFGLDFSEKLYGRIKLDGIYGMGNEGGMSGGSLNPTTSLDYDLGKLDIAFGWKVRPQWAVEVSCRSEIYGKNTSAGENWCLSLVFMK